MDGFTVIDPSKLEYTVPMPREGSEPSVMTLDIQERWLVPPDNPLPVVMVRYGPNVSVPAHSHSEPEFVYIVRGGGTWNGQEVGPGMAAYVPKDVVYGPETSGPEGIEFIIVRPCLSRFQLA